MRFTTVATTKGQLTIPKEVREKLQIKPGVRIDIFPTTDGTGFIGKPQKASRIMDFAGDLKHLDDKKPLKEIREISQKKAAVEIVARIEKNQSQ